MGWNDVDRPRSSGVFLSLEDGETKRVRLLDEEPYTTFVHRIRQNVDGNEVFLTVQETASPDEDFINANTNRFPSQPVHSMRVAVYTEDGDVEGVKVLQGGVQIFRPLKQFWKRYGDIRQFDVEVTRTGEGRETEYTVTLAPDSYEIDVEEWVEFARSEIDFDELFAPPTPQEQEAMIDKAGIDITYDPVEEIAAEMTFEEASALRMPFGKKYGPEAFPPKGKKLGEIAAIDAGFIEWVANNVTSNDEVAAAARVLMAHMDQIEAAPKSKGALKPGKKTAKKAAPSRASRREAPEAPDDDESEGSATGTPSSPSSDEWPLRMSPEEYLEKFPKGPKAALARRLTTGEVAGPSPRKTAKKVAKKTATKRPTKAAANKVAEDGKQDLINKITAAMNDSDRFSEPSDIVDAIREYGAGKTKLRDLTTDELAALYEFVTEE